jgi:hypothetical protein
LQAFGEDGIGVDVGKNDEAFLDQRFGGGKGFDGIRQEIARVGMDFELDPIGQSGGLGQVRQADGFGGVHGAAGVGEEEIFFGIHEIEDVGEGIALAGEIRAPLASRASRISSEEENLPVPMRRREWNSRPAINNGVQSENIVAKIAPGAGG